MGDGHCMDLMDDMHEHMHYMQDHDHVIHPADSHEDVGTHGIEGDVSSQNHGSLIDHHGGMSSKTQNGNQLSLSFQGQVYVFDSIAPEKVQAVLLLLGGHEMPVCESSPQLLTHPNNKSLALPHRVASLTRFRQKRKERNFGKKIRYDVRQEVALRMQRHKGQFTSSRRNLEEEASLAYDWDRQLGSGSDETPKEIKCHHCGINSDCTPMMRRGPDGPRTLCNACGLMWSNKGQLKDRPKNADLATTKGSFQNPKIQLEVDLSIVGSRNPL